MAYRIEVADSFDRQFARLFKKYPSLALDVAGLFTALLNNPTQGDGLGQQCYKVRLAIKSKNRGKSGGARVITCVKVEGERIILLSIYDKSERSSLFPNELDDLLRAAGLL